MADVAPGPLPPPGRRLVGGQARRPPSAGAIVRRRWLVGFAKRTLPMLAVALLAVLALWPEIVQQADRARLAYRRGSLTLESGVLTQPRYRGEDDNHQAYTLTATSARQIGPERIDLVAPVGDILLTGGTWMLVQSAGGVYMQKAGQLDLVGEVTLYRDDGTTLSTDAATLDLHDGALATPGKVHVEGPFGSLDAQGMTATDHGHLAQFAGPGRLLLNGSRR
jgi:lipopolysaccharide export system protein LptC